MDQSFFGMQENSVLRCGRAPVLEMLLPQLTGINLPEFVARDLDMTDELVEALTLAWETGSKG